MGRCLRSRRSLPAPVVFVSFLLLCVWTGGCDHATETPSLLVSIGETQISTSDLNALDARMGAKRTERMSVRDLLQILIDRELLKWETQSLGVQERAGILAQLKDLETQELARVMLQRQLQDASITQAEIDSAYARASWNEQITAREIFVPTALQAQHVVDRLKQGMDFSEAGRQFAIDPYYNIPAGEARQAVYLAYDRPRVLVDALFALQTGGVTNPVPLHDGFVIAGVAERRKVDLLEVAERITETLAAEKRKQLRNSYLRHLKWDFRTDYRPEGMEVVVAVLGGDMGASSLDEGQLAQPVYAFEGFHMSVEEVLDAVAPSRSKWPTVDADAVNQTLSEKHFPNLLMAQDARRKGVHETESFLDWKRAQVDDLALQQLREDVLADSGDVTEADLERFYEANKQRFRIAAWAKIQEILVAAPEEGRDLVSKVEEGADFATLAKSHSLRETEDGILEISTSHAPAYGEMWMSAVMNAPVNEIRGPIRTKGGYSVFMVVERHDEFYHPLSSERVHKSVSRDARQQRQRQVFNQYLLALRSKYAEQVQVDEDAVESVAESIRREARQAVDQ